MRIAPSLYNAPLLNLPEVLRVLEKENVDILHVDVMDGQFVPALSFGEKIVDEIRRSTSLYLDVHLMVREPEQFLSRFGNADGITIHVESTDHPAYCLDEIRRMGKDAGIAVNPGTPVAAVEMLLPLVKRVLVMTVNPGRSKETFRPEMNEKISELQRLRSEKGLDFEIQADGSISEDTIGMLQADCAVSGSYLFGAGTLQDQLRRLRDHVSQ
ncbi:ribulose-phosphate 3-epimerase [Faecalibaculum rodentium]|jgi:ribulose-phosphate 3-epimerase|uniref:ribulose-phosphate 3-epimerase n=1 Tax=Faecalibaculum rodentium TaxID=1702221 RepID=UPI002493177A|nr:ribulose-phosphate 3-epimerase [Faecalibaculum rodentium]